MFNDRHDAGEKLAIALEKYKGKGVLVLAIPRGDSIPLNFTLDKVGIILYILIQWYV